MLKIKKGLLALAVIAALPSAPMYTNAAYADADNLVCELPFKKVATYFNAIKCKASSEGLRSKQAARHLAASVSINFGCNAHASEPKFKVWMKGNRWAYRVTFVCAIIT